MSVTAGRYRHFKGGLYTVLGVARSSETQERLVIYQSDVSGDWWARPEWMFEEDVDLMEGGRGPRFLRMKLRPWEEHTRQNTIDGQPWGGMITYWRRVNMAGEEVLVLSPEGLEDSMCWVWDLVPSGRSGSDLDREVAMRAGSEAARLWGYEV